MTTPDINPHSKLLLEELVTEARINGLVLFVGAGINSTALPLWNQLLTTLLSEVIATAEAEDPRVGQNKAKLIDWTHGQFDVCAKAAILKHLLGPERYRLEIQDALYKNQPQPKKSIENYSMPGPKTEDQHMQFDLLWQVARLASLPQVKAVATFNFDTLLEAAIANYGVKQPRAYFGQTATPDIDYNPNKTVIPIFHLHGLLSPPDTLLRSPDESVVFSYDEYFEKNADPLSWETSTPIHLLRNFTTLWIGVSLKDWNMLRLLNASQTGRPSVHSYCLQSLMEAGTDNETELLPFKKAAMRFQATLFQSVGLRLVVGGETYSSIPDTLYSHITKPLEASLSSPL